jgi:hypothetical protein
MKRKLPKNAILFPCLVAHGDVLILSAKTGAEKFWIKAYLGGNRFLLKDGNSERRKTSFLIDRTGAFREVRELHIRRRWTKPIAWFYDFALSECEISPGISLSAGELLARLRPFKERHVSRAWQLRRYLRKLPADAPFDAARFREYWTHGIIFRPGKFGRFFWRQERDCYGIDLVHNGRTLFFDLRQDKLLEKRKKAALELIKNFDSVAADFENFKAREAIQWPEYSDEVLRLEIDLIGFYDRSDPASGEVYFTDDRWLSLLINGKFSKLTHEE